MKNAYFAIILLTLCPIVKASGLLTENNDEKTQQDSNNFNPFIPDQSAFNRSRRISDEETANLMINTWIKEINALEIALQDNRNDMMQIKNRIDTAKKILGFIDSQRVGHDLPELMKKLESAKDKLTNIREKFNQKLKNMKARLDNMRV